MTIGKSPSDPITTFPYTIETTGLNYIPGLDGTYIICVFFY